MKKLLAPLTLAASLVTSPAIAGEIILGVTGFNASMTSDFTQALPTGASVSGFGQIAASAQNNQFGGGVYFGYVWNVNSGFNINIEGYYDIIDVTVSQTLITEVPLTQKVGGIGGLRALPAFKITNNTELYLELGWAYLPLTFTDGDPNGSSIKTSVSGFRYGAGVQTMLYDNISLRVYYSLIDQLSKQSLTNPLLGTFTAEPSINEFGIGVAYHFAL